MSESVRSWISTLWPIVVVLCGLTFGGIVWGLKLESSLESERNHNIYQIKALKEDIKRNELRNARVEKIQMEQSEAIMKKLDKISEDVITLKVLSHVNDEKFVKRSEVDARLLKTAYRKE